MNPISTPTASSSIPKHAWAAACTLPSGPGAPRLARRATTRTLRDWGLTDTEEAVLLIDELVTNAVIHGRAPIHLRLSTNRRVLLCEVTDTSRRPPHRRAIAQDDEHGRGLLLIHTLAAAYGWRRVPGGKTVWFTYALTGGRERGS